MPHAIQFEITRAVAGGFTAGTFYTFAPKLRDKDPQRKARRKRAMSLGGGVFTTYHSGATSWDCETIPVGPSDAAILDMFLQSVEDGQIFLFDPYNAPGDATPDYRACVLDGDSYAPRRTARRGDGGANDKWVYAFKLLETT